jgi:hypothetical protein
VPRQSSIDFVEGIVALPEKVSWMQDGADYSVLIFRTDSGQKNHSTRPRNGDDFRESSLGPLAVVVIVLLKIWHDIDLHPAIIC